MSVEEVTASSMGKEGTGLRFTVYGFVGGLVSFVASE
jgi:hypothetical protein